MPFWRLRRRRIELAILSISFLAYAGSARAGFDLRPRVGFDFEYFGETYRITDDRDTVSTIDDIGAVVGLTASTPIPAPSLLVLDGEVYYGKESERARLAARGELRRGSNLFLLDQDALWTHLRSDGDYALSSDSFREQLRLAWERPLGVRTVLRVQDALDLVHFADPDQYNLNATLHRPGVSVRRKFSPGVEGRAAYHFGVRDVPDSSELDSYRHTLELDAGLFVGEGISIDVAERIERRIYDEVSPRESSWESRFDIGASFTNPGLVSWRLFLENEMLRYDVPDDLDYDFTRWRSSAGPFFQVTSDLGVWVGPVLGTVLSSTAPAEEYFELALEIGADWRVGPVWMSVTEEFGFRDYRLETGDVDFDLDTGAGDPDEGIAIYSDSTYNRLTILATADVTKAISIRFFGNWEPEDHSVDVDDADSRIVSGGVEYRF